LQEICIEKTGVYNKIMIQSIFISCIAKEFIAENSIYTIDWLFNSSNFNLIENM